NIVIILIRYRPVQNKVQYPDKIDLRQLIGIPCMTAWNQFVNQPGGIVYRSVPEKLLRQLLHLYKEMTTVLAGTVQIKYHLAVGFLRAVVLRRTVLQVLDNLLPLKEAIEKINEVRLAAI